MLEKRIESLLKLNEKLSSVDHEFETVALRAEAENPWFTQEFIKLSADNIRNAFLDKEQLEKFAAKYSMPKEAKIIGLVLAGNIPFVGFHDILCGVLSGHKLRIKCSSKDTALIEYAINFLKTDNQELNEKIEISEQLKGCDAYIATGSNQSNVYFEQYFGKYPSVLRKSRSSVAILTGDESEQELKELGKDVHYYFGLGCRNVSKIFVPKGYNFEPLIVAFKDFEHLENMHKYKNNIDYNLSLLLLNQQMFMSTKALLIIEKESTQAPISVLHYEHYEESGKLEIGLKADVEIQAIVGKGYIPFGAAQYPAIDDFADGVDTMTFLCEL